LKEDVTPIKGNCPVNKNCIFGFNTEKGIADGDILEEIMDPDIINDLGWPCSSLTEIEFVSVEAVIEGRDTGETCRCLN
jgi:hypothetical protein